MFEKKLAIGPKKERKRETGLAMKKRGRMRKKVAEKEMNFSRHTKENVKFSSPYS